ncbi:Transcription factor TFIIIB component B'' like [Melia azedarach]|uniref:Transcription factor TFIIIB component B'' like n=1 Tax=Melia azedarach TaxID=155640 RepID=A0ACC1YQB7_MELAZ|nr:Transcription factor TFIIIB component B'' like [Melia azedarach]
MKDLILSAEYRERLGRKEAKTSATLLTNQTAENFFREGNYHNEENTFASEKENSHFKMSKQETELFYEAIPQFGTDLSMIQQLFLGRTRQQIKLKYKKEECEHPVRLTEALTNRAKDHSHFEKVIEQLQQVVARAAWGTNEDDSAEDVEELIPKPHDEAGEEKIEQDQDGEEGVAEVYRPLKTDGSSDEDMWSSCKYEF